MKDTSKWDTLANACAVGFVQRRQTLCIGLDLAWHGGSANDRSSQFDFLAAAVVNERGVILGTHLKRIALLNRDPDGSLTAGAVKDLIADSGSVDSRIILAIDAPLQTNQVNISKQYRACERHFSTHRKWIDKRAGGSNGWHPNLQPGALLTERVKMVLHQLQQELGFQLWLGAEDSSDRVVIECFPAEAIWAAKRMGYYPESFTSTRVKAYKAHKGCNLTVTQVRSLVEDVLLDGFKFSTQTPQAWVCLVEELLTWMLNEQPKGKDGLYRVGKWLDDAVDSTLCLSTAICYALNRAHVWQDQDNPTDGHIIGPGLMQELLTGRTRMV
jgi:hypothetical protein